MKELDSIAERSNEGRFWWNRLMVVVLAGLIGLFVGKSNPIQDRFLAVATLQIDPMALGIGTHPAGEGFQNDQLARLNSFVETISTTRIMRDVIVKYGLIELEGFAGKHAGIHSVDRLAWRLSRMVKAKLREGTYLVDVRLEFSDRDLTKDLVNWVAEELVGTYSRAAIKNDERALEVLRDELMKSQLDLKQAEIALIEFSKSSNLVISPEDRRNLLVDRLRDLHSDLASLTKLIASIESDLSLIVSFGDSPTMDQLNAVPGIYNSEEVAIARRLSQERERAAIVEVEDSEEVAESLERLEAYLKETIQDAQSKMGVEYSRLRTQERRVQEKIASIESELLAHSGKMIEYRVLKGQAEGALNSFMSISKRIREIESGLGLKNDMIQIVEKAPWSSDISVSPWALSLSNVVFGLGIGIAAILIYDNRHNFGVPVTTQ